MRIRIRTNPCLSRTLSRLGALLWATAVTIKSAHAAASAPQASTAASQPQAASMGPRQSRPAAAAGVQYEVPEDADEDKSDGSSMFLPKIDHLFRNPAVITSLQTGTDALNRSLDSVMDSVFYSLLDNQFRHELTESYSYALNTTRNLFTTTRGAHVVVDRVYFGPEYHRTLANFYGVPITLGAHGHVDVLDIYLRTDAQRLAEPHSLPFWRGSLNNWFGILPLLAQILPPSFNANELYDPLRQLQTPLVFPLSLTSFQAMPIGSIRSYALTGGVSVPFHIGERLAASFTALLARYKLKGALPYTLFMDGEHRINVLRRNANVAWVGLSHSQRSGHGLSGLIGNTFFLLQNALQPLPWQGIALYFSPVDLGKTAALIKQYDHLYEFDTSDRQGLAAYLAAVRGDFSVAAKFLKATPDHHAIRYHFTKTQRSTEVVEKVINNLFFARAEQNDKRQKSEIQIDDKKGTFFVLEDLHEASDLNWHILEGEEEITLKNTLEVNVDRLGKAARKKFAFRYDYAFAGEEPFHLISSLAIKDRFANSEEYATYVGKLRNLSQLPLEGVPAFPLKSAERILSHARSAFFTTPEGSVTDLHVTTDIIGRFYASLDMYFSTPILRKVIDSPLEKKRRFAAQVFHLNKSERRLLSKEAFLALTGLHLKRALWFPLRAFYIKPATADSYFEARHLVESLERMRTIKKPLALLEEFHDLFSTAHPERLLALIFKLAGDSAIPRKVSFYLQPAPSLDPGYKMQLAKLNNATYASQAKFPVAARYRIAQEKATAFYPSAVKETRKRPVLIHVHINTRSQAPGVGSQAAPIFVHLKVRNLPVDEPSYFFLRFETAGKLQLGKYVLGEEVISLRPLRHDPETFDSTQLEFEFDLTGPESPLHSFLFEQGFKLSSEFMLSVAASADRQVWSQEKTFKFRYEGGELKPPKTGRDSS